MKKITRILEWLSQSDDNKRKLFEFWFKPPVSTQLEIGMTYFEIDDIIKNYNNCLVDLEVFYETYDCVNLFEVLTWLEIIPDYNGLFNHVSNDIIIEKVINES